MRQNKFMQHKAFTASLMLCLISALALTAGIVYNRQHKEKTPNVADLNETTVEYATVEDVREILENSTTKKQNTEQMTETQTTSNTTNTTEMQTSAANEEQVVAETEPETQPANVTANALHFDESGSLKWPVRGEVILEYNMDNTIYFPTLDVYKCNSGMMIQGDENMPVYCAGEGVVEKVEKDREFGNMITVNMGDGYEATYGQLNDAVVSEGQSVESGEQIGTLAAPTAYYEVEGYNLYFKLTKDGTPVNPLDYLKE